MYLGGTRIWTWELLWSVVKYSTTELYPLYSKAAQS